MTEIKQKPRFFKLELAVTGEFPLDGNTEDDVLSTITQELDKLGLTVVDCFSEVIEKDKEETHGG